MNQKGLYTQSRRIRRRRRCVYESRDWSQRERFEDFMLLALKMERWGHEPKNVGGL